MHLVRSIDGLIYIDELDLVRAPSSTVKAITKSHKQDVKNLCSGFSYCFSLLGTFYTWYGHGTILEEKRAALEYAQSMAASSNVIELTEEEDDADEMFWMMLGEREYAQAEHWKWKPSTPGAIARIWALQRSSSQDVRLPTSNTNQCLALTLAAQIVLVQSIAPGRATVFIVDCIWEYFVVVDQEARENRRSIMLGLMVATVMYLPPSHFLLSSFCFRKCRRRPVPLSPSPHLSMCWSCQVKFLSTFVCPSEALTNLSWYVSMFHCSFGTNHRSESRPDSGPYEPSSC